MKTTKVIAVGLLAAWVSAVLAQAPFTIIRPVEGARVREVVKVHLPKNSVPPGGYVAVWVNDGKENRFLEATVPQATGDVYEYLLDTKKLGLADGPCTIEFVLHGPSGVLDSSKVNVTIANQQEITVPKSGAVLKYKYRSGTSWVYDVTATMSVLAISEEEEKRGATAAEQVILEDRFPLEYAVYNVYPNGNGLIRIRPVLDASGTVVFQRPGGGFVIVTDDQMRSYFVELNPFGREIYASSPGFADPLDISKDTSANVVMIPLPVLPAEPQQVGEAWAAATTIPGDYHGTRQQVTSVISLPTKATLVGFEWEQNRPCARIRYEFAAGKLGEGKPLTLRGTTLPDAQVTMVQDVWFAMDIGAMVKSELTFTVQGTTTMAMGGQPSEQAPPTRGSRGGFPGSRGGPAGVGPRGEDEGYFAPGPGIGGPATMGPGGTETAGGGLGSFGEGKVRLRMRVAMVMRN